VAISSATGQTTIRFTLDGSTPTGASTLYTAPLSIAASTTLKAAAFRTGWTQSATASATYTMNLAPVIAPAGGVYTTAPTITLGPAIAGTEIRYQLDGVTPTAASALYTAAFPLTQSAQLRAVRFQSGYPSSAVASADYQLVAAAPVFSPAAGNYAAGQVITVATATAWSDDHLHPQRRRSAAVRCGGGVGRHARRR
jgi:hypothetical protein